MRRCLSTSDFDTLRRRLVNDSKRPYSLRPWRSVSVQCGLPAGLLVCGPFFTVIPQSLRRNSLSGKAKRQRRIQRCAGSEARWTANFDLPLDLERHSRILIGGWIAVLGHQLDDDIVRTVGLIPRYKHPDGEGHELRLIRTEARPAAACDVQLAVDLLGVIAKEHHRFHLRRHLQDVRASPTRERGIVAKRSRRQPG